MEMARGRFATHAHVVLNDESFTLDFFARIPGQNVLVGRIFITPMHAKRLADLLKRQMKVHKELFKVKK